VLVLALCLVVNASKQSVYACLMYSLAVCVCSGDVTGSTPDLLQAPADSGSSDVMSDVDDDVDEDDDGF